MEAGNSAGGRCARISGKPRRSSDGEWQIVGIGDFNGDQKPDLLWGNFWRGQIEAQRAILWRSYLNGSNYLQPLTNLQFGVAASLPPVSDTAWQIAGSYMLDPKTLLSEKEKTMLQQEDITLAGGGDNDVGSNAMSSLYSVHGERVLTFPPRSSASKMFQIRKQLLDGAYNDSRLSPMAVETAMGGYNASDPETGFQAWFLNGTKRWGDFTWK